MAPPGADSNTLLDLLDEDRNKEMEFKSDTEFVGPNGSPLATITGEDDLRRELNPFPECGAADMLTALRRTTDLSPTATFSNPIYEHQQQIVDREDGAKRRSKTKNRV